MKNIKYLLVILIITILALSVSYAATVRARATGNWGTTTTWNTFAVPVATDTVYIGGGFTVTLNGNYSCARLYVAKETGGNSGAGTLTINSTRTLTVGDNVTVGSISFAGTIQYQTAGSGELSMTNSAGVLTFVGTGKFSGYSGIRRAINGAGTWAFSDVNTHLVTGAGQGAINVFVQTYPATSIPTGDPTKAITRYLTITPSAGLTATLRFSYTVAELNGRTEANLTEWRYNGTAWVNEGGGYNAAHYVELANVSTWSNWTAADPAQPLPVQIASVNHSIETLDRAYNVIIEWTTISETNNYGFYVEKRISGQTNFTTVSELIGGNGTTLERHNYSWVDKNVQSGTYEYRIKQIDLDGLESFTAPIDVNLENALGVREQTGPAVFALNQNYPNPFNPATEISFSVAETHPTTLKVFSILGKEVATLFNGVANAGKLYTITFNAADLSSGTYFYRIENGSSVQIRKMSLMK